MFGLILLLQLLLYCKFSILELFQKNDFEFILVLRKTIAVISILERVLQSYILNGFTRIEIAV